MTKFKKLPSDLERAITALDKLTIMEVKTASDEALGKLLLLTKHWLETATHERRERTKWK